jgi:hypothetical protein
LKDIVDAEAPVHISDVATRLANAYGKSRVGSLILTHVQEAVAWAERKGLLKTRGDYVWAPTEAVVVRRRTGTGIPAERIPPEEYTEAVRTVLRARGALDRRALTNEVRGLLGFNRTGALLDQAISDAIDAMLASGGAAQGSMGVTVRNPPSV